MFVCGSASLTTLDPGVRVRSVGPGKPENGTFQPSTFKL